MNNDLSKLRILDWMKNHTYGVRNARPRKDICEALSLEDRAFRELCEDLKLEGHIATNSSDGYYFIPLVLGNDPVEIAALKHSINDKRSRAIKLLNQAKKMGEHLERKTTRQLELC